MSKRFIKPPYSISRETSIDSDCCRLYPRPAFSAKRRTNHAPISFDKQAQVSQGHTSCRKKESWNTEVHGGGGVELVKPAREPASSLPKPCASLKNAPPILPVRCSLLALVGRKQTVVRDQLFPQKPPVSRLWFSRTGVQHSPGSSMIELPSAVAESGAYSPDRALLGSHDSAPCLSRATISRRPPNSSLEEACTWEHHFWPTIPPPRLNRRAESRRQPVGCISRGWARPYLCIWCLNYRYRGGGGGWCTYEYVWAWKVFECFERKIAKDPWFDWLHLIG